MTTPAERNNIVVIPPPPPPTPQQNLEAGCNYMFSGSSSPFGSIEVNSGNMRLQQNIGENSEIMFSTIAQEAYK
ncbi:hypothetical protein G9A89_022986 [Geosiphon pyriformis]|nr:hypothetical protein G9A89_022986 [Geosiphon pyriformis]